MRWKKPEDRAEKIKRKFAILPITIDAETRWLEWVTVKYVYHDGTLRRDWTTNTFYHLYGWYKEEFIDDYKGMKKYIDGSEVIFMTVKELKDKLSQFSDNFIVMIPNRNWDQDKLEDVPATCVSRGVNEADCCVFIDNYEDDD